jgi:hypothetical protein
MTYDVIIREGLWFDGTGAPGTVRRLGIVDGRVAVVSETPLDEAGCAEVIDAAGPWVIPGSDTRAPPVAAGLTHRLVPASGCRFTSDLFARYLLPAQSQLRLSDDASPSE